jgi:hypothetical protein
MSYAFYLRKVKVIVGNDTSAIQIPADLNSDNIKIAFEIKKALTGKRSKDNFITLYNLSDATQSFINKSGQRIRLYAGYGDNFPIIFDGQITTIINGRERLDSVYKMTLGDSIFTINNANFSKSYRGAMTVLSVIQDAVASFGLPAIGMNVIPTKQLNNFAFDGQTKTLFTQLLAPLGIDWYVDNGILRFSVRGKGRQDLSIVSLSQDSGMIESPQITEKGVRVKSLLNPLLQLGSLVQIISSTLQRGGNGRTANQLAYSASGVYKINELTHSGDNFDGQMITEILGVAI